MDTPSKSKSLVFGRVFCSVYQQVKDQYFLGHGVFVKQMDWLHILS